MGLRQGRASHSLNQVLPCSRGVTLGAVQTGSVVAQIRYDGLGRRIVQEVKNSADLDATYHFYYDEQSVIEIRDGSDLVLQQYLWTNPLGGYIDELAQVAVNGNPFDDPTFDPDDPDHDPRVCFALHDVNYNVRALVDESGTIVERYDYTPYGERTVYFSPGTNDPLAMNPALLSQRVEVAGIAQPYEINTVGHQGLLHEEAAGLVHNRARMLHPRMGRFMQRDPLDQNISGGGYQDGMNLYQMMGNNPSGYLDPNGTDIITISSRRIRIAAIGRVFGHYSVEYWENKNCQGFDLPVGTFANNFNLRRQHGYERRTGWELLRNDRYRLRRIGGGYQDVAISVIYNQGEGTQHYVIYSGHAQQVKEKWQEVSRHARAYRFAEQDGRVDLFNYWPNSRYQDWPIENPANNSNTFGRWLVRVSGLPMYEHPGPHPGRNTPVRLPQPAGTYGTPIPR